MRLFNIIPIPLVYVYIICYLSIVVQSVRVLQSKILPVRTISARVFQL